MRIARNSAVLAAGQAAGVGLGFLTTILVTDSLGELYGLFIGAQRFVGLFLVIVQFGLHPLIVRAVALQRDPPGILLGTLLAVRCALGAGFALLVAIAAYLGDYLPEHRWVLYAFAGAEILGALSETYVAICQGLERMGRSALITLARSVVNFAGVLVVIVAGGGLAEIVTVYVAGRCAQLLAALLLTRQPLQGSPLELHFQRVQPYLREALPYLAVGYAAVALRSLDVVILTRISSVGEVALYGAAFNFVDVFFVVPLLTQRALLPAFSRLETAGGATSIAQSSILVFGLLLFPAAAGLALLADHAVALYPSGEFADAAPVLQVLAMTLIFIPVTTIAATQLTASGRLGRILAAYAVALPVQVAVDLLLIPRLGALGAAAASVAAHGVVAIGLAIAVSVVGLRIPWAGVFRHTLATGVMSLAVLATRQYMVLVPIAAGLASYLASLAILVPRDGMERRLLAVIRSRNGQAES